MNYGIIAAGEGSRLSQEGVAEPKPLVRLQGQHLVDRLTGIFLRHDAERIAIICNAHTPEVRLHLEEMQREGLNGQHVPLRLVVKTTPSSMHSLYALRDSLQGGPFVVTTVDTIFPEAAFGDYLRCLKESLEEGYDGVMGVTAYVDDEKPLYVGADENNNVTGFYDTRSGCHLVSAGIYGLDEKAWQTLDRCIARGESRMRNFQRALIKDGRRLKAFVFDKVIDIDHATDIKKAEDLLG